MRSYCHMLAGTCVLLSSASPAQLPIMTLSIAHAAAAPACSSGSCTALHMTPHGLSLLAWGAAGNGNILVCERGSMFGYSDLVVDPRNLVLMRDAGCPITADVTHALQQPTGKALEVGASVMGLYVATSWA